MHGFYTAASYLYTICPLWMVICIFPLSSLPVNGEFFPRDLKSAGFIFHTAPISAIAKSARNPGAINPRPPAPWLSPRIRAGSALIKEESFGKPMCPAVTNVE